MTKNIILTETQFKTFIKCNINEEMNDKMKQAFERIAALKAQKNQGIDGMSPEQAKIKANEITAEIGKWQKDGFNIKHSEAELYIGEDNTPYTWEEYMNTKHPGEKEIIVMKQLKNIARTNITKKTHSQTSLETMGQQSQVNQMKKKDESMEDWQKRQRGFDQEKFDLKQKDIKFLETLASEIERGENQQIPKSGNPDLSQDGEFQTVVKPYCKSVGLICTETGEIFAQFKYNRKKLDELGRENVKKSLKLKFLASSRTPDEERLDKLMAEHKHWFTPKNLKYIGFGDDNASTVAYTYYIPKRFRGMA